MDPKEKNQVLQKVLKSIKLQDAGYQPPKYKAVECAPSSSTPQKNYPSLYLDSKNVPSLVKYDTGDEVIMVIKGKIVNHSSYNRGPNNKNDSFTIEVTKVAC